MQKLTLAKMQTDMQVRQQHDLLLYTILDTEAQQHQFYRYHF